MSVNKMESVFKVIQVDTALSMISRANKISLAQPREKKSVRTGRGFGDTK